MISRRGAGTQKMTQKISSAPLREEETFLDKYIGCDL